MCIFASFHRHPTLFVICLPLVFDLLSLLCSAAFLQMLFADADPSHQFVCSSPTLPCTSSQRLHSTKDKMSIFGHPKKEVGQRTAAPERHKESRGALERLAGQAQQKLLFLWKGFPFPSSKNSWQQHASSSFTGCGFLTRQARAAQGTRLSTAGKKPFLPMPTALALLSHIATAENLVLPNTRGITFYL